MEKCNKMSTAKSRYEAVLSKLKELSDLNVDCQEDCAKLEKKLAEDEKLSIALVGAFSDGKTSVIAGLAGEPLAGMTVAVDEATDGIRIYEPHIANMPCRIVDTPGLFGTKEKDVAGELRHFDAITRHYFDEAPVLLYVVESKNPIKDSHKDLLRHVMCDLGKADRTIFVINKMDDVADVTDDEAYAEQAKIKTNTVRMKLQELVGLSMEEALKARVVCISADPDPERRGMAFWKEHMDAYAARSHMGELRMAIDDLLAAHPAERLVDDASVQTACAVLRKNKDEVQRLYDDFECNVKRRLSESVKRQEEDMRRTKEVVRAAANACDEELDDLRRALISKLNGLTFENAEKLIDLEFGKKDEEIGHAFARRLQRIMETHFEAIRPQVDMLHRKITEEYSTQEGIYTAYGKKALHGIKFIPKTQMVQGAYKAIKVGKGLLGKIGIVIKFKPHGIINLAKMAPVLSSFLTVGMMGYELYAAQKRSNDLVKLKSELKQLVETAIEEERSGISGDKLYANYAPEIAELDEIIQEGRNDLRVMERNMEDLARWQRDAEALLRKMQTA